MSNKNNYIIIKDPLYKQILVDNYFKKYLDSQQFQRLRNIKQTAFVDYVYPNANHTRFSHSIGAYHLMNKILNNGFFENISKKIKKNLLLAALLHDIGHGPFSHSWEKVFSHFNHEKITKKILEKWNLKGVIEILEKKSPYSYLLSSTIDIDKLDYMARDSHFSGVSYGVAEVDFILQRMFIKNKKIVIKKSAISSVEDLITQRINLFKTVYYHKFSVGYDFLFSKIFERVKDLLKLNKKIKINKHIKAFFEKKETIISLLSLNDVIVLNQIYEWSEYDDKILKDLCNKFVNRKKINIINTNYEKININKLKKKVGEKYDLKYYFSEIILPINIIQTPIYVEIGSKLKKLEEVSNLIKFYKTQKWNVKFVIFPRDILL